MRITASGPHMHGVLAAPSRREPHAAGKQLPPRRYGLELLDAWLEFLSFDSNDQTWVMYVAAQSNVISRVYAGLQVGIPDFNLKLIIRRKAGQVVHCPHTRFDGHENNCYNGKKRGTSKCRKRNRSTARRRGTTKRSKPERSGRSRSRAGRAARSPRNSVSVLMRLGVGLRPPTSHRPARQTAKPARVRKSGHFAAARRAAHEVFGARTRACTTFCDLNPAAPASAFIT